MINQRKIKLENVYMRQIMPNNLITKVFKDNSLEKIILIQRYFKKYKNEKKIDDKPKDSGDYNNKLLSDIKNISNSNLKNCIDNTNNNDNNNINCEIMINQRNITDENHKNNNENDKEICFNQKNVINNIKVKDNNYKKNIPYKKDSDKVLNLKDKSKIKIENNYNEVTNEQNNITYKNSLNSRISKKESDSCINSFQKNSHTFEKITTSYGTNDNFNFNKTKTSYNLVEKSEAGRAFESRVIESRLFFFS